MKSEIIAKVNKIGNIGLIISRIAQVFLCIGVVGCLIGAIALYVIPNDMIAIHTQHKAIVEVNVPDIKGIPITSENGTGSLQVGGIDYGVAEIVPTENGMQIEAETSEFTLHFRNIANAVVLAGVFCVACFVVMHFVAVLCKKFKECETPFSEEIVLAIRNLAISLIPMALFKTLSDSVANSFMTGKVQISVEIDLTTVLMILLIILLSMIFRYGTMLQQEADETL